MTAKADDKIKDLLKSKGFIEIELIEAKVPDLDMLPGQGESDVFARVHLNDTKELICETRVIQDEDKPKVSVSPLFCLSLVARLDLCCLSQRLRRSLQTGATHETRLRRAEITRKLKPPPPPGKADAELLAEERTRAMI